jgi:hydrogenase expression/formation protein HypD
MNEYISKIKEVASGMGQIKIMEVCGGHTHTIMKYGIREILPPNIRLVAGPGCPVCVTSQKDVDAVVELALNGVKICTYGDMLHVPGSRMSLDDARSKGADIKTVLSAEEVLKYPDHVFFAIGFETTTPMTAYLLKKGVVVYSTHKTMPQSMRFLAENDSDLAGFIDPGHVSTIIGTRLWKSLRVPQVISGFRPDQMLRAIYKLLVLIKENRQEVVNDYDEVVCPEGNLTAQKLVDETMKVCDTEWRGFGTIAGSGLEPRDERLNAKTVYKNILERAILGEVLAEDNNKNIGCRCGEIIRGMIEPNECKLFGKACTPEHPMGACMVSSNEGACAIYWRYGRGVL